MNQNYSFSGKVIQGLQNGRTIGYPTANLQTDDTFSLSDGIYAAEAVLENRHLIGMLYVGTRPTLHLSARTIEMHLFDFQEDIYGKILKIIVFKKIREDKSFDNLTQLKAQIQTDEKEIRQLLQ
ncbi:MAG: riboflavin kinase [Bacteroidales bacterium]|jgi:riboflavin kinase/FMN adenylyltransferase|nr:riboflavin kinase [Bacteroidales bacterium]